MSGPAGAPEDAEDLRARFLAGMSHAAQTVNVVTTDGAAGRAGVTVSAMTSVSADTERPTLLVCVNRDSATAPKILANGVFCVNVLRDDQSWISDTFAGRFRAQLADKFDCAEWVPMLSGSPRVVEPLVAFDCRMVSSDLVGTHHVLFGEVDDVFIARSGSPLIYARRAYSAAARIEATGSIGAGRSTAGGRLSLGCLHTIGAATVPPLIRRLRDEFGETEVTLIEGDQARLHGALGAGEVDLALMEDDNLAEGLAAEPLTDLAAHALLAADDPLAARETLAAEDLRDRPLVLLSTPASPDRFLTSLHEQGIEPRIACRSTSIEGVRCMVGQGLGTALLASPPTGDLTCDGRRVVRRPLAWPVRPGRLMLVRRRGASLSSVAERFVTLCRDSFSRPA